MKRFLAVFLIISAGIFFSGKAGATEDISISLPSWMASDDVPEISVHAGDENDGEGKIRDSASSKGYGGWGGPTPMLMFPNPAAFDNVTDLLGIDEFPNFMFFIGGMGMGQLGPNFRIGGGGGGGNMYTSGEVNGFHRDALINVGYGGLVLYGVKPLNKKWDIYTRILLGGGIFNIRIKGDDLPEELDESEGFFAWHPAIGLAYHPVSWMSVELEGGYFGMVLPEMYYLGEKVVQGGLAGGPAAQLNILFGYASR